MTRPEAALLENMRTIAALAESQDDHRATIARIARAALIQWRDAHIGATSRAITGKASWDSKKGRPSKT